MAAEPGHDRPSSVTDGRDTGAGEVFGALIAGELLEERATKTSLEQRGIALITSAGVLLTLLTGVAAFAGTRSLALSKVGPLAGVLLLVALTLFVAAAVSGLMVNTTRPYREAKPDDLAELVKPDSWAGEAASASRRVAALRVEVLREARAQNSIKAGWLQRGVKAEVAAVAFAALGVMAMALWPEFQKPAAQPSLIVVALLLLGLMVVGGGWWSASRRPS